MAKPKRDITVLWIVLLSLFVVVGLFLGSGTFEDLMENRRRAAEGWHLVRLGDFKPLSLRPLANDAFDPEFGTFSYPIDRQTSSVMYLKSRGLVPNSRLDLDDDLAKAGSYAKLVTPSGAYVLVPICQSNTRRGVCAVQIPDVHPANAEYLEMHVVAYGGKETVIRIDRPPQVADTVPQDGPDVTKVVDGNVTITGEAFPAVTKKKKETIGIGCRIHWNNLPPGLHWQVFMTDSIVQPFTKPGLPVSGESGSSEAKPEGSIGLLRNMPYAPDVKKVRMQARLEGYEEQVETVDFGTVKVFEDLSHSASYCLDIREPIVRKLSNGLVVKLLPLRTLKDLNSFLGGESLYFRLRVEPDSLRKGISSPPLDKEAPKVEARLLGFSDYYSQISPEMNPAPKPDLSDLVMIWWAAPKTKVLPLKFSIRRLVLKRRIPIDLRLPVDESHPREAHLISHSLRGGGTEFFK